MALPRSPLLQPPPDSFVNPAPPPLAQEGDDWRSRRFDIVPDVQPADKKTRL